MTDVPVDDPETLRRILANTEALLLDFDGPICSVFAGFPARVVADQLRDVLVDGGHQDVPDGVAESTDPFDVLKYAATLGEDEARYVEAAFRSHEVEAIATATPTPGAHQLIITWKRTERPLAIVSNNSRLAVESYLEIHQLTHSVGYILARNSNNISLLKPSPYLIEEAVRLTGTPLSRATLIGDSVTDVEAAHAAKIKAIGYANKFGKAEKFTELGAEMVTTSISLVTDAVQTSCHP